MTYPDIPSLVSGINTLIVANGTRDITGPELHDILIGITSLFGPALAADLTAQLGTGNVGGVTTGTFFASTTTLESILRAILIQAIPPTYIPPTSVLSRTGGGSIDVEVGTSIISTFSAAFTQNNGGALSGSVLQRNGSTISSSLPYSSTQLVGDGDELNFVALQSYATGACVNNNLSVIDCTGRIAAGAAVSNTIAYRGFRNIFYGTPGAVPSTSTDIRILSSQLSSVGNELLVEVGAGSLNVIIALPAGFFLVSVIDTLSNLNVISAFSNSTIAVQGASGYSSQNYTVYVVTFVESAPQNTSYQFNFNQDS